MSPLPMPLSRTQRSARAVAEALFSDDLGPPPAARLDWVIADMADLLAHAGTRARALFQLCLLLVSWLAPLWIAALPPLRRLSVADRVRALTRMEHNPRFAPLILACKAVLCIVYYEDEAAARSIDAYEPCSAEKRRLPVVDLAVASSTTRPPVAELQLGADGAA